MAVKFKYLFISVLLAFIVLNSCNTEIEESKKNTEKKVDLKEIIKRGKLIALTGYNAYSYFIYKGKPMGYEYELLQLLGKDLGVEVEIKVKSSIKEMIDGLNNFEGDIIAFNLTVTKDRSDQIAFTYHHNTTKQVLVQRRPKNWRRMRIHEIEDMLIRSPLELEGKTVYVRAGSSYLARMKNLSEEIGGDINIVEAPKDLTTEDLIRMVAEGEIDYTVSDENIAELNQAYYPNIDISTELSLPQKIAWAVRKNSVTLLDTINSWIKKMRKKTDYYVIYNKYYKNRIAYARRRRSELFAMESGKISKYDDILKKYAIELGWDWRILASQVYQESQFDPNAKSWAGAVGLMQLMPETAKQYGVKDPRDPIQSLHAGFKYVIWLDNFWKDYIEDKDERMKFVLASYNIGFGHILHAMKLAQKYGANPKIWFDNVESYLLLKSQKKYYTYPVVRNGYCEGRETVRYVREILERFTHYQQFIS